MSAPLEKHAAMKPESTRSEDPPEGGETKGGRRHGRFKGLAQARLIGLLAAAIAFLEKLKQRLGGAQEEPNERHHIKAAPLPQAPAEAQPPRRHRRRNVLLILGAVLLTGFLSAGVAYRLFSKMVRDQAAKIESQQQDINAYQLEEQQQATRIADTMRLLDAERARRLDAEKRLADTAAKPAETDTKANGSAAEPVKGRGGDANTVSSFQTSTFKPPEAAKVTNCNLVANDVEALKRCLEEFNRK